MIRKIIIGVLLAAVLVGGGVYFFTQVDHTPIGKILKNPREYDGKVITIAGDVTDSTSLLVVKFFKLKDKTGEITVITKRSLPNVGAKERVKGHVEEAFSIGDQQMLVFVEGTK
ncbi:MAG: hypothetical protein M0024_05520 [Nitrospiraceae bacterium]|nr:hypothetical protein [Nitrospiraceae bacterium]